MKPEGILFASHYWRDWVYPIGFVAYFIFTIRFTIQWIASEMQGKSVVPRSFWHLSLFANALMVFHSLFQVQYFVCIVQASNAVISWRNLNFMKEKIEQVSFRTVVMLLLGSIALVTLMFAIQGYLFFEGAIVWARTPTFFKANAPQTFSLGWHLIGVIGITLFAGRFWVQWWDAEKHRQGSLGLSFWWLSVIGAVLSIIYFLPMYDFVNIPGPALGLIPYIRNLIMLNRAKLQQEHNQESL